MRTKPEPYLDLAMERSFHIQATRAISMPHRVSLIASCCGSAMATSQPGDHACACDVAFAEKELIDVPDDQKAQEDFSDEQKPRKDFPDSEKTWKNYEEPSVLSSCEPRISRRILNQRERRSKRRLNPPQDPNERGSSHADVDSSRTLRSRGQKRAPSGDIEGGSNGSSSNSSDDEVEDETFRVEHRTGKGPAEDDSEDEEKSAAGAGDSDDDDADDVEPPVINRP
ncbi:hypothetical protein C2845_PM15G02280 [Panicum miliaceum]|uniref:Uncharacterized protein n=1 Tax=Panicum miliaceum TaxID=4540 RepID=A0A3L6Q5S1_PANMI|nr:hypothetical protein C2845_PM15G02280 [Panicum miliaceum]